MALTAVAVELAVIALRVLNRLQFVDHRGVLGVTRLCWVLQVSRSGCYRWIAPAPARVPGGAGRGRCRAGGEDRADP